jgi:hypothetical protein
MAGLIVRAICTPFEVCFNCIGQGCAKCSTCIENACSKPFSCFVFSATCLNAVPIIAGAYSLLAGHGTAACTKPVAAGVLANCLLAAFNTGVAWWLFQQFNKPYLGSSEYSAIHHEGAGDTTTTTTTTTTTSEAGGGNDEEHGVQAVPLTQGNGAVPEYRVVDRAYNLAMWSPFMLLTIVVCVANFAFNCVLLGQGWPDSSCTAGGNSTTTGDPGGVAGGGGGREVGIVLWACGFTSTWNLITVSAGGLVLFALVIYEACRSNECGCQPAPFPCCCCCVPVQHTANSSSGLTRGTVRSGSAAARASPSTPSAPPPYYYSAAPQASQPHTGQHDAEPPPSAARQTGRLIGSLIGAAMDAANAQHQQSRQQQQHQHYAAR